MILIIEDGLFNNPPREPFFNWCSGMATDISRLPKESAARLIVSAAVEWIFEACWRYQAQTEQHQVSLTGLK